MQRKVCPVRRTVPVSYTHLDVYKRQRLHVAQPPVSYQLKLLEEEFGVQLVVRGPRRISLTDAGKVLYTRARSILHMTDTTQTLSLIHI